MGGIVTPIGVMVVVTVQSLNFSNLTFLCVIVKEKSMVVVGVNQTDSAFEVWSKKADLDSGKCNPARMRTTY